MAEVEEMTQMIDRCADCAFRAGTTPRSAPLSVHKANLCVLALVPFHCHEAANSVGSAQHVCKGFVDAVEARIASGYYDQLPEWKRKVYLMALDAIDKAEQGGKPDLIAMIHEQMATL